MRVFETIQEVFTEVNRLDQEQIECIQFHSDGTYTYLFNSPTWKSPVEPKARQMSPECSEYVIPREGDLLLGVEVQGTFEEAALFQYDELGSRRLVYSTLEKAGCMNPFPTSGIPLLQMGKPLYLEVKKPGADVKVTSTCAFLDTKTRRALATYTQANGMDGIKAVHANQTVYQVTNIHEHGHSPNCFVPVHQM